MSCNDHRVWSFVAALVFVGCSSLGGGRPARPAPLLHLVYFELAEPSDEAIAELASDCDALLAPIPSVQSYAVGRHHDIGRDGILDDYDLFLLVGFEDESGYRAYLEHPDHVALVERWRPRFAGLRIHDVGAP